MLYYVIFLNISLSSVIHLIYMFSYHFSFTLQRTQRWKITHIDPLTMHQLQYIPKKYKLHYQKKNTVTKYLSKLVNKNTLLNLKITSDFLNILASPYVLTWYTIGGTINKTIKHLGLTRYHRKTVEITWHMVNKRK